MALELGERYGISFRDTSKYLLIQATEEEFEGADGTMLVFEKIGRPPETGERARNIVVRNTPVGHLGTRVAFVDSVKNMSNSRTKFHIGIFIPKPSETGFDVGTTVKNVVDQLGLL